MFFFACKLIKLSHFNLKKDPNNDLIGGKSQQPIN